MRRTTICRSSRAALCALVAGLFWASVLRAQDTTKAAGDTTTAAAPAQGQLPPSHTVTKGETLWSIAQQYFGDPLLWPEIYRQNTSVIDDPHWIYPGEVLTISPGLAVAAAPAETSAVAVPAPTPADTVRAQQLAADTVTVARRDTTTVDTTQAAPAVEEAPPPPPPPPPPAPFNPYTTIFDRPMSRTEEVQHILKAYAEQPYRPLRRGEFYSAGWLTEQQRLPWARVLGNTALPAIPEITPSTTAHQYDEIAIQPPGNASYHVSDSLLVARIDREVPGWGGVVVPLGIARVTAVQRRQLLAAVVAQFGRIHEGDVALPLEPFKNPGQVRPAPVAHGLEGEIIGPRDVHVIAGEQQILFIDRGSADGISPGDIFEVYTPAAGQPGTGSEEVRAILMVVHTRDHSASGLVIDVLNPNIEPGMPVRLIKKMPS